MLKTALAFIFVLSACASTGNRGPAAERLRERTDIGSLPALSPSGKLSTCTQFSVPIKSINRSTEVKQSLAGLNLNSNSCEIREAVGICENQSSSDSEILIYNDVYYYAPTYTRESADVVCKSIGGHFVYF